MIRTLALAAAAAAVGYVVGRRVSDEGNGVETIQPTGNAVGVDGGIDNTRHGRVAFDDDEEVIGR